MVHVEQQNLIALTQAEKVHAKQGARAQVERLLGSFPDFALQALLPFFVAKA